jgi:hypothetical protein
MDSREMKKLMIYRALVTYQQSESYRDIEYELGIEYLDKDPSKVTAAEIRRARRVLDQLLENAESNL